MDGAPTLGIAGLRADQGRDAHNVGNARNARKARHARNARKARHASNARSAAGVRR